MYHWKYPLIFLTHKYLKLQWTIWSQVTWGRCPLLCWATQGPTVLWFSLRPFLGVVISLTTTWPSSRILAWDVQTFSLSRKKPATFNFDYSSNRILNSEVLICEKSVGSTWISGLTFGKYVAEEPMGLVCCQEVPEVMGLTLWEKWIHCLTAWWDRLGDSYMYFLANGHSCCPKTRTVQWWKAMPVLGGVALQAPGSLPGLIMWRSSMMIEEKIVSEVSSLDWIVSFPKKTPIRLNSKRGTLGLQTTWDV